MPITREGKYYDFEELYFERNCDNDKNIINFFSKYKDIKGDTEYITYKIKKTINDDRKTLMEINGDGKDYLNRIGKQTFIKHYVIPEQNKGKEYYIYSINSFI
jgi:hypothetical protein